MMAKPMKTLELHYPTIQFLIKSHITSFSTNQIVQFLYSPLEIILDPDIKNNGY